MQVIDKVLKFLTNANKHIYQNQIIQPHCKTVIQRKNGEGRSLWNGTDFSVQTVVNIAYQHFPECDFIDTQELFVSN